MKFPCFGKYLDLMTNSHRDRPTKTSLKSNKLWQQHVFWLFKHIYYQHWFLEFGQVFILRDAFKKRVNFGTLSQSLLTPSLPRLFWTSKIGTRRLHKGPIPPCLHLGHFGWFFGIFKMSCYKFKKHKCKSILLFLSWTLCEQSL